MQRILDDGVRRRGGLHLVDFHDLPLELRVVLEEPAEHDQPVTRVTIPPASGV